MTVSGGREISPMCRFVFDIQLRSGPQDVHFAWMVDSRTSMCVFVRARARAPLRVGMNKTPQRYRRPF